MNVYFGVRRDAVERPRNDIHGRLTREKCIHVRKQERKVKAQCCRYEHNVSNMAQSTMESRQIGDREKPRGVFPFNSNLQISLTSATVACALIISNPASADVRLPPIDKDPNRCERAFVGNTIGQSNAVSDRVLDLRFCELPGADLHGVTLSGALVSDANLEKANMTEAVMTKMYGKNANFEGADFTSSVVDRVEFKGAKLARVNFYNAVITGTNFEGADVTEANFEEALIGSEDVKRLCSNPTLKGDSRFQVGCRD